MLDDNGIRVFFSSKTIGVFKGREGMIHVCHTCDRNFGIQNEYEQVIPPEIMALVFSAELASQELGVDLRLIDINRLNLVQRMKEKVNGKPIPRISIGEKFITGDPTKDEIIALYYSSNDNPDSS
jgi:hypothetical protein